MQKSNELEPLVMFEDVLNNFIDHIHKEFKKREVAIPPQNMPPPPVPKPAQSDPPKEEEKKIPKESKSVAIKFNEPAIPMVTCVGQCGGSFPEGTLLYLNECLHTICKDCLETLSFDHIVKKKMGTSPAACPTCGAAVSR